MNRAQWRIARGMVASCGILCAMAASASAWQDPAADVPDGAQVLTQGPIHEAFAEPVLFDPKPGPIVPKEPPRPVPETPPDQKPEGENVQWIPGYWAWDDGRSDFIWVSGVWRALPPGRQWVPGYWQQAQGGFQWVPGYWGPTDAAQVQYLPEPPASLENGPSSPQPVADATWAPGTWVWQDANYAWRPGFWVNPQPGWMWVPASYYWSPRGYVYSPGYWDYPLINRGLAFAPVYFSQPVYLQPRYSYVPTVSLLTSALFSSLFVRPSYHSYYFGDYYAANNFQSGIYPWYSFHGSRYGYDPIYAYAATRNFRTNPRWADELHETYRYRREHPEARPARTYAAMASARETNALLARPLSQYNRTSSSNGQANALRLERLDEARRAELARQTAQFHAYRDDRLRREQTEHTLPKHLDLPHSPITTRNFQGTHFNPPPTPHHPEFDRTIRSGGNTNFTIPKRHEPHPDVHPPSPSNPPGHSPARKR